MHHLLDNALEPGSPQTLCGPREARGTDNTVKTAEETPEPVADTADAKLAADPDASTVETSGCAAETAGRGGADTVTELELEGVL